MSQLDQIAQAWQLHQAGALSLEEFTDMKKKLLSVATEAPAAAPRPAIVPDQADTAASIQSFFGSLAKVVNDVRPSPQGLRFGTFSGCSVVRGKDVDVETDYEAMDVDVTPQPKPSRTSDCTFSSKLNSKLKRRHQPTFGCAHQREKDQDQGCTVGTQASAEGIGH